MNKPKVAKEVSEHFSNLGKKSWESRKKKLLKKSKVAKTNPTLKTK